jgi:hypothetical protein
MLPGSGTFVVVLDLPQIATPPLHDCLWQHLARLPPVKAGGYRLGSGPKLAIRELDQWTRT